RGAVATLEALALGATDYATKPQQDNLLHAKQHIERDLVAKVLGLKPTVAVRIPAPVPIQLPAKPTRTLQRIDLVAIGSSTGGPNALMEVIPRLPADMPVPVVIVQHMPPLFTKMMAERLTSKSAIPVHEGAAGVRLEAGHVWIAPGDYHMTVARRGLELHLELNQGMPENSCRPAV